MVEANKRLELDSKNNSQAYDIEVLDGNDSEVIEIVTLKPNSCSLLNCADRMVCEFVSKFWYAYVKQDLMLGVADLHTPEALAAAESAIAGNQLVITVSGCGSSGAESDGSSDESDGDGNGTSCPRKLEKSDTGKVDAVSEATGKSRSKKRSRIVELS